LHAEKQLLLYRFFRKLSAAPVEIYIFFTHINATFTPESVKHYVSGSGMKTGPPDLGTISHVSRCINNEVSMVVASGYLEVNGIHNVAKIADELNRREIGINEITEERIMFLMEKESVDLIKSEIALLRDIEDVRRVYLTYYSVENR